MTLSTLEALFTGHEPFLHEPSRAAAILHTCTGARPERVAKELARWERRGWVRREDGGLRPDLDALEALERPPEERRLRSLARRRAPAAERVAEALRVAEWWRTDGRPGRAAAVLRDAFPLAQEVGGEVLEQLLARWAGAAFAQAAPGPLNEVICALEVLGRGDEPIAALMRALEARSLGGASTAEGIPPLQDDELDSARLALAAATFPEHAATLLAREGERFDTPRWHARVLGARANMAYEAGDYAAAAHLRLAAIEADPRRGTALSQRIGAAMALLEVDPGRAESVAELAAAEARRCRHALFELSAVRIGRKAGYVLERPLAPRPPFVQAALAVDAVAGGLFAVCEAAFAVRAGDREAAARLAAVGRLAFAGARRPFPAALCAAIEAAAAGATRAELATIVQAVPPGPRLDEVRMQIFALANQAVPEPAWARAAAELAEAVPVGRRAVRIDVLSARECADAGLRLFA